MSTMILPLLWPERNHNCGAPDGYASHMKGSPSAVAIAERGKGADSGYERRKIAHENCGR